MGLCHKLTWVIGARGSYVVVFLMIAEISSSNPNLKTDKYGPAPTQSASSNSGAGGSSHAPINEEESSMYMVSVKYYFHHSNIYNNILGQWDKRSSPSRKKPLPVWLAIIRPFFYQTGNGHLLAVSQY